MNFRVVFDSDAPYPYFKALSRIPTVPLTAGLISSGKLMSDLFWEWDLNVCPITFWILYSEVEGRRRVRNGLDTLHSFVKRAFLFHGKSKHSVFGVQFK